MIKVILTVLLTFLYYGKLSAQEKMVNNITDSSLLLKSSKVQHVFIKFPKNYDNSIENRLLIVLHGNGGTAKDILSVFNNSEPGNILLVFPEGQYPKIVNGSLGFSWYYETNEKEIWEFADKYSVENLIEIMNELSSRYKISQTYVLGFSQGASLAYMTGLSYPEIVTGAIAIGGLLPEINNNGSILTSDNVRNARNLRLLIARGNNDKLITKKQFNVQRKFFEENEFDVLSLEYDGGHFLTDELLNEIFEWINATDRN
jgi:phospholipase/carboxylesterase